MQYKSVITSLVMLLFLSPSQAQNNDNIRVIVKYKAPVSALASVNQLSQLLKLPVLSNTPIAGNAYSLQFKKEALHGLVSDSIDPTEAVLKSLGSNPNVIYAVKDRLGHFKPLPTVSEQESNLSLSHDIQWDEFSAPAGIKLESAPGMRDGAWAYTTGLASEPIVIAVLDTGIALNSSLMSNLLKDNNGEVWGWNFAGNNRNLSDETKSYHGTHVAGTIAALGDVMLGVGEHLKVLPLKIPDKSGMFYESQVINAIYWSVGAEVPGIPVNPYPAKVLNMSFGIDESPRKESEHCDLALQEAMAFVREKGAVVVVAAGNENHWEHFSAPAVCEGAIRIASTGPSGLRAYYSNYGPSINFAAPGGDLHYGKKGGILSTVNPKGGFQGSGFDFYQGTSMATPHAAGVAGLIYAVSDGAIRPEQVEQILSASTHAFGESKDPNDSCMGSKPCGHGILDAENAVKAALANYNFIFLVADSEKTLKENAFYAKNFKLCQVIGIDGIGCY